MKIGVLATGYNCEEYFDQVLEPWLQYKDKHGDLVISAVSALFKEYTTNTRDKTQSLMAQAFQTKKIDDLVIPTGTFDEATARNLALTPLLNQGVDYVILLDFDEVYTLEQIEKIVSFVQQNEFTTWFKIRFKNYVIDKEHYVDDFCPPRIFSTNGLADFYYDNDVHYYTDGGKTSYKSFPSMEIPRSIAFVKHYSWCGTPERLKQKVDYQLKHFNGICSYRWDENTQKLALSHDFYQKCNVPVPTIYEEKQVE